jgi:hypothetical protein
VRGAAETVFGFTRVFKSMAERRGVYQPNAVRAASMWNGRPSAVATTSASWRLTAPGNCQLNAISEDAAVLNVEGSIQGLNLKEFFLLLSSTGLAYRRCELIRVNGTEMDVQFLNGRQGRGKKK